MAGILAVSSSKTMVDGDTSVDNTVAGYVTGEQITLTVTDVDPTSISWGLSIPSNSAVARSGLDDDDVETVHSTPDVGGYYTVTANVDGTVYVLRISVVSVAQTIAEGVLGLQPMADVQVPTPAAGNNLYYSSDEVSLAIKDALGIVSAIPGDTVTLDSTVVVSSVSDLPTPVGGVITCAATGYLFDGIVDIGTNSLRAVTGTVFYGHSFAKDGIVRSGSPTGAMIEVPAGIGNCSVTNLTLDASAGGTVLDVVPGAGSIFVLDKCITYGNIGVVNSERPRLCRNVHLLWTTGLEIAGSSGITLEFCGNVFNLQIGSGVAVDITGTWSDVADLFGNTFITSAGGIAIRGLASGANIGASGVGLLNSGRFHGRPDSAYLDTLDPDDAKWTHANNEGIASSIAVCSYSMVGNSTETPDAGSGVWTKVLGTTTASVARRFIHTDNRATCDARSTKLYQVAVALLTDTDTNNTDAEFGVSVNGADPTFGEPVVIPITGGVPVSFFLPAVELESSTPDYVEVWTRNTSGADVTVTRMQAQVAALATGT